MPVGTMGGVVKEPTIEGTCMRRPAFTRRSKTFPVTPVGETGKSEAAALVLLNATPLMR